MLKKYVSDLKSEFSKYNMSRFKRDLLAGITVTAVALPLALAFGVSCGATAAAGLITAILAGLIIGALSGGSFQISGPTGAMTAILIVLAQKYGLSGIWTAGLLSGIFLVAAGLLKFGRVVSFIPAPVITGFTSGIALIIAIGQLDNVLGVRTPPTESSALKLAEYFKTPLSPNWYALLTGGIVIAVMLLWPKKWTFPSSLAGLALASGLAAVCGFPLETIGEIPKTLFPENRLTFDALSLAGMRDMLVPALSIAALGMIESLLCGEVAAKMKKEKYDANRDLVAQGVGNMIIPFFGGVPATAAIARTSVGIKAGGVTRLVSVFHALGLLLSMFLLAPIMSEIPLAALAGVLMVTAWRMNEWKEIRYIFSRRFKGAIAKYLLTMAATVIFDLTQAILIGVVFALILFVVQVSNVGITVSEVDAKRLSRKEGLDADALRDVRVAYLTGPLFFATVGRLRQELTEIGGVLIISMRGVTLIDMSGIQALEELRENLMAQSGQMMVCSLQPQVESMLRRSGLLAKMGENAVFWSADKAIEEAARRLL